jgi:hypothetical protein
MGELTSINSCHQAILSYYGDTRVINDIIKSIEVEVNEKVDRYSDELYKNYDSTLFEFIWLRYLISKRWIKS